MTRCEAPGCRRRVEETFCAVHASRAEVAWLKEQQEVLRVEGADLRRHLRALAEQLAVVNAQVVHLMRYTTLPPAQKDAEGQQGSILGSWEATAAVEASGEETAAG